jgi:fluoride exporter
MKIYDILYVGIGGFFGSAARYLIAYTMGSRIISPFPIATLSVNILGSFILGVLMGFVAKRFPDSSTITLILGTGFCGGFTTFSTFAFENLTLWHQKPMAMLIYIVVSVIGGIAAVGAGLALVKFGS